MKINHLKTFSLLTFCCLFLQVTNAQTTKEHTEKFAVNDEVDIHVNTTHTNVKLETWDKNEVEVTFMLQAEEQVDEWFEKWDFEATGNSKKVNIESKSGYYFDMGNYKLDFDSDDFQFDFDMKGFDFNFDFSDLHLDIDDMVSGIMEGLNLEDLPRSPFGKDADFDGDEYRKNPETYLKKMNDKYGTQVSRSEVDQWLDDLEEWAEKIDVKVDVSRNLDLENLNERIAEQTEEIQESVEKWQKENEKKIKEITDKYQNFNYFDQDRSQVKKTIHIKIPKKAKLHLNVRYGEVTLAQNLRNINADLNYASLSANSINGEETDISAAFAPVFVNHWKDGQLKLRYCKDLTINKASKINLKAQGTNIVIGTLLNSGLIHQAYGDLEIHNLGAALNDLNLKLDYGTALLQLDAEPIAINFTGNRHSSFSLPEYYKIVSDSNEGLYRILKAYHKKPKSEKVVEVKANYGVVTIR